MVLGLSSKSTGGRGPVVQVGNSYGAPTTRRAVKPVTEAPTPPPPPPPPPTSAKVRRKVKPRYTADAQLEGIEGEVVLKINIDARGRVTKARVIRGLGYGLDESARRAVLKWRYTAATRNGRPVPTRGLRVRVTFELL